MVIVTLAITRSYKNEKGKYDTDFIECVLWKGVAENTMEYCKKGDSLGVKGRLTSNKNKMEAIANATTSGKIYFSIYLQKLS